MIRKELTATMDSWGPSVALLEVPLRVWQLLPFTPLFSWLAGAVAPEALEEFDWSLAIWGGNVGNIVGIRRSG